MPFPIINFLFGRRPAPKGRWPPLSPLHLKKALASKRYDTNWMQRVSECDSVVFCGAAARRRRAAAPC
jgi:hypothetical protein